MSYVRTEDVEPGIRVLTLDKPDRLNAIDFFYSLADGKVREFLIEIKQQESDPFVLMRIDNLLAKEGQS